MLICGKFVLGVHIHREGSTVHITKCTRIVLIYSNSKVVMKRDMFQIKKTQRWVKNSSGDSLALYVFNEALICVLWCGIYFLVSLSVV